MQETTDIDDSSPSSGSLWRAVKPWLLVVLAALVLSAVMRLRNLGPDEPGKTVAVGQKLPRLSLTSATDDAPVALSDLVGQVTLINFWGPWCYFCREEMPDLIELHRHFQANKNFRFLSVTCPASGQDEDQEFVTESLTYLKNVRADFPVYRDSQIITRLAILELDKSDGFGYPTTLILDGQGVIRGHFAGYRRGDDKVMTKLIDDLLNTK